MKNYITVWNYDIFVEIMLYHFYESFEEIVQRVLKCKTCQHTKQISKHM